jgi:hypothetical protein
MSDFTTIRPMYNNNTDASPTYAALAFGGSAGANEIRWSASGAGGASTGSASWPQYSRPVATGAVPELWAFASDASGVKIATYTGTNANANVLCVDYDNLGTFATAPTLTAYSSSAHNAPVAGTQPGAESGSPIINGQSSDTSSTSYLKGNLYGDDQTGNPAAGSVGSTLLVTSGSAGSVSPGAAAWLATWQSLQGAIQFITHRRTPAATTAGKIFFTLALFTGPTMSLGNLTPVVTFTYSYV